MLKTRSTGIAIVACLADKSPRLRRFARHRRTAQSVTELLQGVIRQMQPSLLAFPALTHYPWCFVAPDSTSSSRHYTIGAFLPPQCTTIGPPEMLYARVDECWLLKHLQSPVGMPLWLSRALVPLINGVARPLQNKEVRQVCHVLQRLHAPERRLWKPRVSQMQARQLEYLCARQCEADDHLQREYGVDAMPWMNWPGCIQHNQWIWLWRQSRHGKIIESQKVSIS